MTTTLLRTSFLLAVCSASYLSAQSDSHSSNMATDTQPVAQYLLAAGDVIELHFFYNPELNQKVQIRPDGRVSLPLIGEVELANKSVPAAIKDLETGYAKNLTTPSINLQIVSYANQKVYVGGEVQRPGPFSMPGQLTVLDAVMEAGGIKHTGKTTEVLLIRNNGSSGLVMHSISLRNQHGTVSDAARTILQPFDVVLVPESKIARADRWVDQYLKQLNPASLSGGFTYLFGTGVIP
jgi:polysaccharide export outer membrane protein